jgi:hypothetical protein
MGVAAHETGVVLYAGEAPRLIIDQQSRTPDALIASLATGIEHVASPRERLTFDALLLVGPDHGRVFREASWSRERMQQELYERTAGKFADPQRILLAYAGGDAGLFSMVFGSWAAGSMGSQPQVNSVERWR